jgi:hypothetical protein
MSYKTSLIRMAIKWTPNMMILWVANIMLKGIAELIAFSFDLDARKIYVHTQLIGEAESIEVWMEDFAIISEEESYKIIIHQAQSNRIWLDNILSRLIGKAWTIPVPPQFAAQFGLMAELFKVESL